MRISKLFILTIAAALALGALPCNAAEAPDSALAAYQRKDYDMAYQLALPAAQSGDANAQYVLGKLLWRGLGVTRNDADAAKWFTHAVEKNNADAMADLAVMYQLGEGLEKDLPRGLSLLVKAGEMGSAAAPAHLGRMYQYGEAVKKDLIRARYWLERADAVEAAAEWATISPENRPPRGTLQSIPSGCKPKQPPTLAMRQSSVKEAAGSVSVVIDNEGRIRGITGRNVSVDALRYAIVALFSVSLRSTDCVLPMEARNLKFEIPFRFELR